MDGPPKTNVVSVMLRWLFLVIALGPIPTYGFKLPWQYWVFAALFLALWVEVEPVSKMVSKLLRIVTHGHAGMVWAIYCAAFLWCTVFGWGWHNDTVAELALATVLLFVAGFLSGGTKDDSET